MKIPVIDASTKFEKLNPMQIAILKDYGKLVTKEEAEKFRITILTLIKLAYKIKMREAAEKGV